MGESAASVGVWMASDVANLCAAADSLNVLVLSARSIKELVDLVGPVSKKLKGGVTVWSKSLADKVNGEISPKIRFRRLDDSTWDIVVFSPVAMETAGTKGLKADILHSLTLVKLSGRSRVIICVPSTAETSPVALRVRV